LGPETGKARALDSKLIHLLLTAGFVSQLIESLARVGQQEGFLLA
jgi:hypothetical protein